MQATTSSPARRRAVGTRGTWLDAAGAAIATLEELFPGRVFLGVGSRESLNECPVGCDWPDGETQLELMEQALDVIRARSSTALATYG